ncbi:MAG: NAD(P)H-dependent oxidoreductase subunit E [Gammaproteobacteria bacterium]|nr:NAD(P)H-dependent oxidoreductase subunit E [Gammaproteobacteria bacterium]
MTRQPKASNTHRRNAQKRGRTSDPAVLAAVRALLGDAPRRRDLLIEFLHRIQDHYGYLGTDHLVALAEELKLSGAEVYEVATFYHHFDVVRDGATPPPPLTVRVCDSISCMLAGADDLVAALERGLGDGIRVQRVPCVGRCDCAPVAVVGLNPLGHADAKTVIAKANANDRAAPPTAHLGYDRYRAAGGYALWLDCVAGNRPIEDVLKALDDSQLKGLGGAGFPAGRKWRVLREQPKPRLIAVNIDEGEPGTFKDRHYLERDPHRFLEGMLIAAWAIEAEACYIYLRDEYASCRAALAAELDLLRQNAPAPLPHIELRRGAGAYVCGEESAMIESIEGKRGMPRLRPPFVAEVGLFGRPTLEHNMETLYWIREILERGAAWFASQGRHGRKGLRSFSVSGRVNKPGVHLAPAGITLNELIDEYCGGMLTGHELYGYLPGGASGGMLPAHLADVPLDFGTLQEHGSFIGSAAVMVFSRHDSARAIALNAMRFFEHESCGKCTPCRVGTAKAAQLMAEARWDTKLLGDLARVMEDASICGLGQAAPNPLRTALKYFPEEFE